MLFKIHHLRGIKEGKVSLAFRRWKSARVKKGSLIKTPIGELEILDIKEWKISSIKSADAKKAGYESLDELLKILRKHKEGKLYRIRLKYSGEDRRIALRNNAKLSKAEFEEIKDKLDRFDKFSKQGPWTEKVLVAIRDNPKVLAADIAEELGYTKAWFKPNVRKLKNLGLTISHMVGYELSPRGKAVLKKLLN